MYEESGGGSEKSALLSRGLFVWDGCGDAPSEFPLRMLELPVSLFASTSVRDGSRLSLRALLSIWFSFGVFIDMLYRINVRNMDVWF